MDILAELAFNGEVPLLAVRQMPLVELTVDAGIFSVRVGEVEERRRLVLGVEEAFVEQGRRRDAAVGAAEQHVGIEAVAAAAQTRVPARIAERLIKDAVAAAHDSS